MNIFIKRLFAEGYDKFYKSRQGIALDKCEKKNILGLINKIQRGKIFELGCGTGHWTKFFCRQGFQVKAIDESEAMINIAESKRIKHAVFQKADAANLPFANQSFSVVASITMLEFVEDVTKVFDEIDRVLKPRGHLILGCLNNLSELGKNKHNDEVFKYARFFKPDEIEQMLLQFGTPILNYSVYYSPTFELLDGTERQNTVHPAFIAATVQKTY